MSAAIWKIPALVGASVIVSSCQPVIRIVPCRDGNRLAFAIPEVFEYGIFKRLRPIHAIAVYEQGSDHDLWFTDDRRDKHDRYLFIPYGVPLKGWTVGTRPSPLRANETYHVMIVGDRGDAGDIEFKPIDVIAQCPAP